MRSNNAFILGIRPLSDSNLRLWPHRTSSGAQGEKVGGGVGGHLTFNHRLFGAVAQKTVVKPAPTGRDILRRIDHPNNWNLIIPINPVFVAWIFRSIPVKIQATALTSQT